MQQTNFIANFFGILCTKTFNLTELIDYLRLLAIEYINSDITTNNLKSPENISCITFNLSSEYYDRTMQVVVVHLDTQKSSEIGIFTSNFLNYFKPKFVGILGVCEEVKQEELKKVLIVDTCHYQEKFYNNEGKREARLATLKVEYERAFAWKFLSTEKSFFENEKIKCVNHAVTYTDDTKRPRGSAKIPVEDYHCTDHETYHVWQSVIQYNRWNHNRPEDTKINYLPSFYSDKAKSQSCTRALLQYLQYLVNTCFDLPSLPPISDGRKRPKPSPYYAAFPTARSSSLLPPSDVQIPPPLTEVPPASMPLSIPSRQQSTSPVRSTPNRPIALSASGSCPNIRSPSRATDSMNLNSKMEKQPKGGNTREGNLFLDPHTETQQLIKTPPLNSPIPPPLNLLPLSSSFSSPSFEEAPKNKKRVSILRSLRQSSATNLLDKSRSARKTSSNSATPLPLTLQSPKLRSHHTKVSKDSKEAKILTSTEKSRRVTNSEEKKSHSSQNKKKKKIKSSHSHDERAALMRSCDAIMGSRIDSSTRAVRNDDKSQQSKTGSSGKSNAAASTLSVDTSQLAQNSKNDEFKKQRQLRWKQRRRSFDLDTRSSAKKANVIGLKQIQKASALYQEQDSTPKMSPKQVLEDEEPSALRPKALSVSESVISVNYLEVTDAAKSSKSLPSQARQKDIGLASEHGISQSSLPKISLENAAIQSQSPRGRVLSRPVT
jgi:hypothetical protein